MTSIPEDAARQGRPPGGEPPDEGRASAPRTARNRRPRRNDGRVAGPRRVRAYIATNADRAMEKYGPLYEASHDPPDPDVHLVEFTLDEVLVDIVKRFDRPPRAVDPRHELDRGFAGQDVVIWAGGEAVALVRRGVHGHPEVIRLGAASDREGRRSS